ncbi:MAG: hypothetical protein ACK40V_06570, partial [Anaerolineales bacterium]
MQQSENLPPEQEPTVLDLYKSATKDWNSFFNFLRSLWDARKREELNASLTHQSDEMVIVEEKTLELHRSSAFPWLALFALALALVAQSFVEPPQRQGMVSVIFYLGAFGMAIWSYRNNEWHLPALPAIRQLQDPLYIRLIPLMIAVVCAGIAFYDFKDGLFTWL